MIEPGTNDITSQLTATSSTGLDDHTSVLDDLPPTLAVLQQAIELQRRAAAVGFDWLEVTSVIAKIEEEIREIGVELETGADPKRTAEEIGDLLFACVNLARYLNIDPESALRGTNAKFARRFRRIETWLAEAERTPSQSTLAEMDVLWERAKREEHSAGR